MNHGRTAKRNPHKNFVFVLKRSFLPEFSRACVSVRLLSAYQIAEQLQYALFERKTKG